MSSEIPFGAKRVFGQLQKGDAIYDPVAGKFAKVRKVPTEVIIRKTKMLYPCAMPEGAIAIRRCTVDQPVLPGTEEAVSALSIMEAALPLVVKAVNDAPARDWETQAMISGTLPEMELGE